MIPNVNNLLSGIRYFFRLAALLSIPIKRNNKRFINSTYPKNNDGILLNWYSLTASSI